MSPGSPRFAALFQEILQQGYSLRCHTLGSSMFPLLRSGSAIQVENVRVEDLRQGDVVVYHRPVQDKVVAHRLVRMEWEQGNLTLITRGDSFPQNALEYVNPKQILGRVISLEWGKCRRLRLDTGLGRLLGLVLERISFPLLRAFLLMKKLKAGNP